MTDEQLNSAHDEALLEGGEADVGGIGDSASYTLRKENGVLIKGPDPEAWEFRDKLLMDDTSRPPDDGLPPGYVDEELSMKGPDPDIWARDDDGNYTNR